MAELSEGSKAIIEKIAREMAEQYLKITKEIIDNEIRQHKSDCELAKFNKVKTIATAGISGVIVAIISWLLRKM